MKIWTQEEEAERLRARFEGVNRAAFARDYGIKGGQASVYQHINGIRPISLDAAKAYAHGFKVPLAEISPRLAKEVAEASVYAGDPGQPAPLHAHGSDWPFSTPRAAYDRLSNEDKAVLDQTVARFIAGALATSEYRLELPPAASDLVAARTSRHRGRR